MLAGIDIESLQEAWLRVQTAAGALRIVPLTQDNVLELAQDTLDLPDDVLLSVNLILSEFGNPDKCASYLKSQALEHSSGEVRKSAIRSLSKLGNTAFIDIFIGTFASTDAVVRPESMLAISRTGDLRAASVVAKRLRDRLEFELLQSPEPERLSFSWPLIALQFLSRSDDAELYQDLFDIFFSQHSPLSAAEQGLLKNLWRSESLPDDFCTVGEPEISGDKFFGMFLECKALLSDNDFCCELPEFRKVLSRNPHRFQWMSRDVNLAVDSLEMALQAFVHRRSITGEELTIALQEHFQLHVTHFKDPYHFAKATFNFVLNEIANRFPFVAVLESNDLQPIQQSIYETDLFLCGHEPSFEEFRALYRSLRPIEKQLALRHLQMRSEEISWSTGSTPSQFIKGLLRLSDLMVTEEKVAEFTPAEVEPLSRYIPVLKSIPKLPVHELGRIAFESAIKALQGEITEDALALFICAARCEHQSSLMTEIVSEQGSARACLIEFVATYKPTKHHAVSWAFYAALSLRGWRYRHCNYLLSEDIEQLPDDLLVLEYVEVECRLVGRPELKGESGESISYYRFSYRGGDPESLKLRRCAGSARTVDLEVAAFRRRLLNDQEPESRMKHLQAIKSEEGEYAREPGSLGTSILAGLEPEEGVRRIVIFPTGDLWRVPFDALQVRASDWFTEKDLLYVSQSPIAKCQVERTSAPKDMNSGVVIAAPDFDYRTCSGPMVTIPGTYEPFRGLLHAREEGEAVAKLRKVDIFSGPEASKRALLNLNSPSFLHVATHAFYSENQVHVHPGLVGQGPRIRNLREKDNSVSAGLVLSGVNVPDDEDGFYFLNGIVTRDEISRMRLNDTRLVVLSACTSGLGPVFGNHGTGGLRESFISAGAACVLSSLWEVRDDIARELMVEFYERLEAGERASEALRKTRRSIRARYPEPILWSSFVLHGEDIRLQSQKPASGGEHGRHNH